jgi:hypothetical protein
MSLYGRHRTPPHYRIKRHFIRLLSDPFTPINGHRGNRSLTKAKDVWSSSGRKELPKTGVMKHTPGFSVVSLDGLTPVIF